MNQLALRQTAQAQIAQALAEVFDGKQFRFWKKGKETWFVAKDLVEAAGGTWHATRFQEIVGEGCTIKTPLEINGISQTVLACTAKTAVKWLSVSRLPSAEKLSDLVFDILGRVMDGEDVNKHDSSSTTIKLPDRSTDIQVIALAQYASEMELSSKLWKTLGIKRTDRDAEAIEVGRRIEKRYLVTDLVPPQLANKTLKITASTKKVVETQHSGKHFKPVRLAVNLGYAGNTKSAMCVNLALCAMGLQMRHPTATNGYLAIGAGVQIANKDDIGPHKDLVTGWEPVRTTQALQDYFTANPEKAPRK